MMTRSKQHQHSTAGAPTIRALTHDVRLLKRHAHLLGVLSLGLGLLGVTVGARPVAVASAQQTSCPVIAGLPVYTPATCLQHKEEQDDGVLERENRYVTSHAADTVRRFFERAFAPNGWTVAGTRHDLQDGEWKYLLIQGQRSLELKIEQKWGTTGTVTQITLAEQ